MKRIRLIISLRKEISAVIQTLTAALANRDIDELEVETIIAKIQVLAVKMRAHKDNS